MRLYHYTSVDTLEKILKNKTIRFNNLSNVDDLEERSYSPYSKYIFVSCWTDRSAESIPLWRMYTNEVEQGVRISMDSDMFKKYPPIANDKHLRSNMEYSYIDYNEIADMDYFPNPLFGDKKLDSKFFLRRIEYVNDPQFAVGQVEQTVYEYGQIANTIALQRLGVFKNKSWEFQSEMRFWLSIWPFNPNKIARVKNAQRILYSKLQQKEELPFSDFFLNLADNAFEGLIVRFSPNISQDCRDRVKQLIGEYAPMAKIEDSDFVGRVKIK